MIVHRFCAEWMLILNVFSKMMCKKTQRAFNYFNILEMHFWIRKTHGKWNQLVCVSFFSIRAHRLGRPFWSHPMCCWIWVTFYTYIIYVTVKCQLHAIWFALSWDLGLPILRIEYFFRWNKGGYAFGTHAQNLTLFLIFIFMC